MTERYEDSYLYRLRHSAAHLLAQAVTELFPGAKLSIGPPIENGYYYDIDFTTPLLEGDLPTIEKRMKELAQLDQRIERKEVTREEARALILDESIAGMGEAVSQYKLELLDAIPGDQTISFYDQQRTDRAGTLHRFLDLCRGPHVESTKEIKAFKLMSIAGAYWRGNVKNKQLTRIYGTAFATKEELEVYLTHIEEAKKRDHRILGKELGLFMFSARVGTGLPLWLPKGAQLRMTMIDFMNREQMRRGYQPVVTPHIGNVKLWDTSGHSHAYKEKMFPFMEDAEKETYVLKPMNCPFHIEIYRSQMRSYRDLPVRLAEMGTVYRYEQSGEVNGILRARGFTQDDAHLFVRPDQLLEEFTSVVDLTQSVLGKLGLTSYRARVGTKDPNSEKYIGDDENWQLATQAILDACDAKGLEYEISVGDAAFYGPKLDIVIKDALGRDWQMGTVQVDYNLPERFDLEYIGEDSKPHRPVMIHRAPFGSLERMIGLLTEEYAGAFPFWLAPVQIAVLPVADRHHEAATHIAHQLRDQNDWRLEIMDRSETLGRKIREAQLQKIPYMMIIGDKFVENQTIGLRSREAGDVGELSLDEIVERLSSLG